MDIDAPTRVPANGGAATRSDAAGRGPAARPSPPQHAGALILPPRSCTCCRIGRLAHGESARTMAYDILANAPAANA
eukprot:6961850-Alexandrium_andersonii.AAC.1